jgi:hypothetical protein
MKHKMGGVLEFVLWNVYLSPHSLSIIGIEFLYSLKFQQKKKKFWSKTLFLFFISGLGFEVVLFLKF